MDADGPSPRPEWIERLQARADAAPQAARVDLYAALTQGRARFGSIEPALAIDIADAGLPLSRASDGWEVGAPLDAALERIARWLGEQPLAPRWRDERLPVVDDGGRVLGAIERSVVRRLGIATHAVHLVGSTHDARVWVQQRALDKAVDPGLWDTTMGGLMSAGESVAETLERETWEEAGLRIGQLQGVREFGRITVRRPVAEGYLVEHIHCFEALLPQGLAPANQDGEVMRFEAVGADALDAWLEAERFTVEAALVLLRWKDGRRKARR